MSKRQIEVTIHLGASRNEVIVKDGNDTTVFDRNTMDKGQQSRFRRLLTQVITK